MRGRVVGTVPKLDSMLTGGCDAGGRVFLGRRSSPPCVWPPPSDVFKRYIEVMATIQVRDLSDEAHATLRQRAKAAGMSLLFRATSAT